VPGPEPASPSRLKWGRRLGLRREVLILLPVSVLLLSVLSTAALFAYRSSLLLLAEERRGEAGRAARAAASRLGTTAEVGDAELRRAAPEALAVAVVGADGTPLVAVGELPSSGLLEPLGGLPPTPGVGVGPGDLLPGRVAGFAPLGGGGGGRILRLDLPAAVLAGQLRTMQVLLVVVLGVNAAVAVLIFAFLGRLLSPYERLLDRAREVGGEGEGEDEVAFVISTFERAVAALARQRREEADGGGVEEDLRTLERTLGGSLGSGLLLLDRAGLLLSINPVGAELLEVPRPPHGASLGEVLAAHPDLAAVLDEAVASGAGVKRREVAAGARTLGLTVHPLRRDDGTVRAFLVLFSDLTEARRRESERRLDEGLARLGEMAAGVAHELRNSVATLAGYLSLIERRPPGEPLGDYLGEIRRETEHLQRVVEDFLAFARPGTVRSAGVDLEGLARRAAADPALAGARVEIAAESAEPVRGDPQLLERLLRNLLRNAVEAERRAGRPGGAEVWVRRSEAGVEVAVADRGGGLAPEVRERLFHPFVTGHAGGVGLGLAVSHRIATLHGATLHLEDRPGGGVCARLLFPPDTFVSKGNDS
jgi:signal transduction histidine kinase